MHRDDRLADELARAAGLTPALARMVLETAKQSVKAEHPGLAAKVDALFADEARASRAIRWIAKLASGARPQGDASDADQ